MTLNLLTDPWLPVIRISGERDMIAPSAIVGDDPPVAFDLPRADFAGAMTEFLIGLFATAYSPANDAEWARLLFVPPAPDALAKAFAPLTPAFALDGEGPRFMQDFEDFAAEPKPAAALLIDQPGEQGIERNTDLFVKGGGIACLSRAAAAMALYTLQAYAPGGGRGYRVSMRGGGPLTTLVDITQVAPDKLPSTLWTLIWANVPTLSKRARALPADLSGIFPWMGPTRTSEKDQAVVPTSEAEIALAPYWGMPRRIRLDFAEGPVRRCDVLGIAEARPVQTIRTLAYGPKYESWIHPLSPYYRQKPDQPGLLPYHAQPGGIRYRHWPNLAFAAPGGMSQPAKAVVEMLAESRAERLADAIGSNRQIALRAFGYDMDNMKARCWYEARVPVECLPESARADFDAREREAVQRAETAVDAAVWAIKCARTDRPKDLRGDFDDIKDAFWQATESDFKRLLADLHDLVAGGNSDATALLADWDRTLRDAALALFDRLTPLPHEIDAMKRVIGARGVLKNKLRFDKAGKTKPTARKKETVQP
jgi:CRISPR system Cascade subunit CasA